MHLWVRNLKSEPISSILEKIKTVGQQALEQIQTACTLEGLDQVRIFFLGKKGVFSLILRELENFSSIDRPQLGQSANLWKRKIQQALLEKKEELQEFLFQQAIENEKVDITLPSKFQHQGKEHLITQTIHRIIEIFFSLGFDVASGPEVETEYLNFEALNISQDHPAREMQDSFFLTKNVVLRTQTSCAQIRAMQQQSWPIRIVCAGAVYRRDDEDPTHSSLFHQLEGLWVDQNIQMSDLKGVLEFWAKRMFGNQVRIRFRPSYFPFVEPGAEVDISCFCQLYANQSKGECRICKGSQWIEVLGAGMVHPELFKRVGYLKENHDQNIRGFAFGMGIERLAMLLYQIPDIRYFFQGDLRFLSQF